MAQEINFDKAAVLNGFKAAISSGSLKTTNRLYNPATLVLGAIFDFTGVEMKDDGDGNWVERYKIIVVDGPNVAPLTRPSVSPLTGLEIGKKGEKPRQESIEDNMKMEFPIRALMGARNTALIKNGVPYLPGQTAMSVVELFQMVLGKVIKVTGSMQDPTDTITLPTGQTRKRTCYTFHIFDTVQEAQDHVMS